MAVRPAARTNSRPNVVLVFGVGNYAHYMWNELPALMDIERWSDTRIDEVAVVNEPLVHLNKSSVTKWAADKRHIGRDTRTRQQAAPRLAFHDGFNGCHGGNSTAVAASLRGMRNRGHSDDRGLSWSG